MERTEITAEVVAQFDALCGAGTTRDAIVRRRGITPYVAGLLAQSPGRQSPNIKPRKTDRRVRNIQRGVDAATIRRIQRMLLVGQLNHHEIAREAIVRRNLVYLCDKEGIQGITGSIQTISGPYDLHGKEGDPLFVDPAKGDFRLRANSPARRAAEDGKEIGALQSQLIEVGAEKRYGLANIPDLGRVPLTIDSLCARGRFR